MLFWQEFAIGWQREAGWGLYTGAVIGQNEVLDLGQAAVELGRNEERIVAGDRKAS